ncbi:MAG TPA: aspartate kinase [Paludibacteraceae bacterium]|nr:aspartate kinase [Paludibacteraceae bacterium]HQB68943.1 aspartate kinase [Paludibacteraceae bacterium]HRS67479.1 aspartate kinase [Paludibacteraceae bacterium]
MKVFKFGGASVKNAEGVRNLHKIIRAQNEKLVIVVSAMGKVTNALEEVLNSFFNRKPDLEANIQTIVDYHEDIVKELFIDRTEVDAKLNLLYTELRDITKQKPSLSYDYEYDRIVSFGELISTTIVAAYIKSQGDNVKFVDIRSSLKTDDNYREGNVNIELSNQLICEAFDFKGVDYYITQGFIAGTITNQTTTLGREGSDYTAAILANLLDAESVVIWKDVPGVMNADPKMYSEVVVIPKLSYKEAIELSYCGASVIHPKTVKPLQNKKIPLCVKSFVDPTKEGSVINEYSFKMELPPVYINKANQVLLTLTPRDFSFIAEEKLSKIFAILASYRLKVSLIQTSAISFSLCIDHNPALFKNLVTELQDEYEVLYNTDVELITIRHYTKEIVDKLVGERLVFVEQRNRLTARFVVSE